MSSLFEEMQEYRKSRQVQEITPVTESPTPILNRRIQPTPLSEARNDPYTQENAPWSARGAALGVGRTLGRIAIRPVEDIYNAANEVFQFGEKAEWDEALFGDPVNNAEEIASEVGSFLVTFLLPGGAIAKGVTAGAKSAGITAKTAKITSTLSKTAKGRKVLKYTAIGAEGSIAGAVADYLSSDTGDETGLDAIRTRLMDTMQGAVIGAGLNVGGHFLRRYVGNKIRILRARKGLAKAIEKGADPTREMDNLGKALKEEQKLKGDVFQETLAMENMVDDIDIDNLGKRKARVIDTPDGPKVTTPARDVEDILPPPKDEVIDEVDEEIYKAKEELRTFMKLGQPLSDQINDLVALTKSWNSKFDPIFAKLTAQIDALKNNLPTPEQEAALRETIIGMELRLEQHKVLMEYRAIAGNIAGKNLRANRGDGADFSKPFEYKEGAKKRIAAIDALLDFIKKTRRGENINQDLVDELQTKITTIDQVAKTGKLDVGLRKTLEDTQESAAKTIWEQYKKEITEDVLKHLTPSKAGQKALLDQFSKDVTNAIKGIPDVAKEEKVVRSALEEIENLMANPEKIKEGIEEAIAKIGKSKLPEEVKENAIAKLSEVLEGQVAKGFFETLPSSRKLVDTLIKQQLDKLGVKIRRAVAEGNEVELIEEVVASIKSMTGLPADKALRLEQMVREQLGNTIADIRDETIRKFITSELYQKFMLSGEIAELEDMAGRPINEIKEYLMSVAKQRKQTPDDIKFLRKQRDAAKAELEKQVNKEYFVELLKRLNDIQEYQTSTMSPFALTMHLLEQWRYNVGLLQSFKTYFIGPVSAITMLGVQPIKEAIKTSYKSFKKSEETGFVAKLAQSLRYGVTELTSTYEYFANFTDSWQLMKNTFRNRGFSVFNPKSVNRHVEYVSNAMDKNDPTQLMFKDRKMLKEMIRMYGDDTPIVRSKVRKFFDDLADGTPENLLGKAMDVIFSLSQRVMGALDDPTALLATRRALRARLTREGLSQGLDGEDLAKYIQEGFEDNISKAGGYPMWRGVEEMHEIEQLGLAVSFRADYTDQFLSATARSFANWSRHGHDANTNLAKIAARWSVPFIKTPTAVLQFMVDNFPPMAALRSVKFAAKQSPLHEAKRLATERLEDAINIKSKAVTKSQREAAEEAIATQKELLEGIEDKLFEYGAEVHSTLIMASGLGIFLNYLATSGTITGSGAYLPKDMRENMRRSGYKFNTIKMNVAGKEYVVDHSRLEPYTAFLSGYADYANWRALQELYPELEEDINTLGAMTHQYMIEQLGNKYFVKGLFELIRPMVDEEFTYKMTASSYLESLSPRALREINLINEEFEKQYVTAADKLYHRITGLSTGTYLRNALGEKADRKFSQEGIINFLSPITIEEAKSDPILGEVSRSWGKIGYLREYKKEGIQTRDYRNEEGETLYNRWMDSIQHEAQRKDLKELFKMQVYKDAPPLSDDPQVQTKADLINSVIRWYRNDGWERLKEDRSSRSYYNTDGNSWKDDIGYKEYSPKTYPTLEELGAF